MNATQKDNHETTELLRFMTAGSVDDGKSTLIGRLLYDSKSIFDDQWDALKKSADITGAGVVNLANLTDGLRAEREQGITIDVAYRYFATPKRRFIIADTPGHVQYTRNMVTAASTVELALLLVDAREGVIEQTRRHAYICSLLRVPKLIVCINKMDLVGYSQKAYEKIVAELNELSAEFAFEEIAFVPISALVGDNVVERSSNMDWYIGPPLLAYLEAVRIPELDFQSGGRMPVQYVIRPQNDGGSDFRGYAGLIGGGQFSVGDEIVALPSGKKSRIKSIHAFDEELDEAGAGDSVTFTLDDNIDISRGDMIVTSGGLPTVSKDLDVTICWMHERPLRPGQKLSLKHTTKNARCVVKELIDKIDIDTMKAAPEPQELALNDIGRVRIRAASPLVFDAYQDQRSTGGFILIDETTHETVGAALIRQAAGDPIRSSHHWS